VIVLGTICGINQKMVGITRHVANVLQVFRSLLGECTVQGVSKEGMQCRGDHVYLTNTTV
jgi:hypothetical protein